MDNETLPDDKVDFKITTKIVIRDETGRTLLLRRGEIDRSKLKETLDEI